MTNNDLNESESAVYILHEDIFKLRVSIAR